MLVITGLEVSRENSAVQMREASSGQRTLRVSALTETAIGPCRTPLRSAGRTAATLTIGIRNNVNRIMLLVPPGAVFLLGVINRDKSQNDKRSPSCTCRGKFDCPLLRRILP